VPKLNDDTPGLTKFDKELDKDFRDCQRKVYECVKPFFALGQMIKDLPEEQFAALTPAYNDGLSLLFNAVSFLNSKRKWIALRRAPKGLKQAVTSTSSAAPLLTEDDFNRVKSYTNTQSVLRKATKRPADKPAFGAGPKRFKSQASTKTWARPAQNMGLSPRRGKGTFKKGGGAQ
jgi:hypothetical protein